MIELKLAEKVSWSPDPRHGPGGRPGHRPVRGRHVRHLRLREHGGAAQPVIAYLDDESVALSGVTPPIVNASPDSLGQVLEQLLDDRHAAARIGIDSVKYVRAHHDGTATAAALASFLTV
ncbi:Glycosyl transferases group 1 OS=Streptomyces microflavus OX=1919 GN=Smic_23940 PE=4 SV=1 [Streptomyces microflavus]